ncbi:MAG: cellulase family glycosylhydrolase, partial [Planctomycetes bacterium]|nr:cellulase family glycosylhydrolase [Planctomycetota bacterium]
IGSSESQPGTFFWPLGVNLRSVNDPRAQKNTDAIMTANRGSLAYKSYLERYGKAGANCAEIWMCSWNLALEWKKGWPGFKGLGHYNQDNAQRLDDILDYAYANDMRIILVLNNHGQASSKVDSEWSHNPYNARLGGPIRHADDLFDDPQSLQAQHELRRYIIARYADHPAIMAWKLWTEMDLTNEGLKTLRHWQRKPSKKLKLWHQNACNDFHQLDIYQHPVVTHWSSNYLLVDRNIAALPQLDALCIDAYHDRIPGHTLLAQFMANSTLDPRRGLAVFKKPVLVTEFGGTPMACAKPQLIAEHLSGPWAGLVSGHGGSPLLWWFEWIDQHDLWQPYRAISCFLQGEDLRGKTRSVKLQTGNSKQKLWSRAWATKGRILGYVLDYKWGYSGGNAANIAKAKIHIGAQVKAGKIILEWWDASLGTVIERHELEHPGGALEISIPPFRRHLAFKMLRP